jgi:hypothetical protein
VYNRRCSEGQNGNPGVPACIWPTEALGHPHSRPIDCFGSAGAASMVGAIPKSGEARGGG